MLPISVCMIVKNEEEKLSRCLSSIESFGWEIVIVDTGSSDRTKDIARQYTEKIYDFAWCDDFAAARNFSLEKASHDWIFMIDADEVVEDIDLEEMDYFIHNLRDAAGAVTRRSEITTGDRKAYQIDRTERLFSRKKYHYIGRIHEQLLPIQGGNISCFLLNTTLWHDGYDMTEEERLRKAARNISLVKRQMEEEGENSYLCYQLGKGYEILREYGKACECFEKGLDYQVDPELAYVQEMVISFGNDLLQLDRKEEALGFAGFADMFQSSADFLYLMGQIYEENEMYEEAVGEYQKARSIEFANAEGVNSALSYFREACVYYKMARIADALQSLEQCREYQPAEDLKQAIKMDQEKKRIAVFVATHAAFTPPDNPLYIPLHVGREGKPDLGYLGDNVGVHISDLNMLYGELTGLFWMWQNVSQMDYAGMCHYRRYFLNDRGFEMQREEYLSLLLQYDAVVPKHAECDETYLKHYGKAHNVRDLEAVGRAIEKLYPEYIPYYRKAMEGKIFYSGNLFVTSLPIMKGYAEWLFSVFAEASEEIDVTAYDAYHRRVYGFLSEQMMYIYMMKHNISFYEAVVGISEEKEETKRLKEHVAVLLSEGNIAGAKALFEDTRKDRPDVFLAGSDINGELRMMYQIVHLCHIEEEAGMHTMVDYAAKGLNALLTHYKRILKILQNRAENIVLQEDIAYLRKNPVSDKVLEEIIRCTKDFQAAAPLASLLP